ncbi:hypothetical protein Z517_11538 [Fonsecaea pedrosoi CBS 271.37]|uniref:Uncharacterized protein n=1 Tax=Fonsecaea pedrosoi CBS 271.37 TaxID=1442368 RepID=A0A0D2G1T1_9EURO|nr:uncharacterized protein Z517_11538 [Fonsecaea pedrosoi CBS 271.37]KIW74768.1 hypothetical protein Z517_11538 [Fonsecaea pedrosoi CBS 271.37]
MDLDHLSATDQEILDWCYTYQLRPAAYAARLLGPHSSNVVLRLNNQAVLAKLPELSADEKSNVELLQRAYFWKSLNALSTQSHKLENSYIPSPPPSLPDDPIGITS